jgi:imidazolonepropionase-like amidohydrolase
MVDAGMTPAQVLSAATLGGAGVMGREADLGTLAAGKLADLLILDGDPAADSRSAGNPARSDQGRPHPLARRAATRRGNRPALS